MEVGQDMQSAPLVRSVLNDVSLTRGLGDGEAKMLVEWLVDWAEMLADMVQLEEHAWCSFNRIRHRAKIISRFVCLWGEPVSRGAAFQLIATEKFEWPLPKGEIEPMELMDQILDWESRYLCSRFPTPEAIEQEFGSRVAA